MSVVTGGDARLVASLITALCNELAGFAKPWQSISIESDLKGLVDRAGSDALRKQEFQGKVVRCASSKLYKMYCKNVERLLDVV